MFCFLYCFCFFLEIGEGWWYLMAQAVSAAPVRWAARAAAQTAVGGLPLGPGVGSKV